MSTQKGNTTRTRPQKYQNKKQFKNNLHDTSHNTKLLNSIEINNVCIRCKNILEWKIKYKKYKPLKNPSTCVKCKNKNVKHAYHTMCRDCAEKDKLCPKCGQQKEIILSNANNNVEKLLKLPNVEDAIKSLSERKRRTFYRKINNSPEDYNTEELILEKLNKLSSDKKESDDFDFDDLDLYDDSDFID